MAPMRPHDDRILDREVIVEFAVAVRVPGTAFFVDAGDAGDYETIVVDLDDEPMPLPPPPVPPSLRSFGGDGDEEDTSPGQHTIIGPLLHPRRPATARP